MRDDALCRLLQAPGRFKLGSVMPSGDCFYDCVHELLPLDDRLPMLADAGAMRDLVAESLTDEIFALYQMYAAAGVEDFAWLNGHHAPQTLEELRAFAKKRGHDCGAGHCLWADDYAINKICELADIVVLIIDEQAPASGSRSGRKRQRGGDDEGRPDSRFVMVGEPSAARVVILHRSRRQHFSPVRFDGGGACAPSALPAATRALWPKL